MTYFSEREAGTLPRDRDSINEAVWGGIRAIIRSRVEDGSFGARFPAACPDGRGTTGTDETAFWDVMRSEIPNLDEQPWRPSAAMPSLLDALDMIEFCWRSIGKPIEGSYHSYFGHHHLSFDIDAGRSEFRDAINRIFRRNGLVFELNDSGEITRLAPLALADTLSRAAFRTGDSELDRLLDKSRRKFLDADLDIRRESLEALWDAWERLKTLNGMAKKAGISSLLDSLSGSDSPRLRAALEQDAIAVTDLGNHLRIRHSETDREAITSHSQVDYLYHRLFALVQAAIKAAEPR
jgi:hypothetical protein